MEWVRELRGERQKRDSGSCYLREFKTGIREVRDSTIDAQAGSRSRALRLFATLGALAVS